ncbi:MAG: UDP-N-acetylmuramoyl-tripeptide--D-alanyl-D-alanine ligase [Gammaproteobacteria bacterium]|nr:UDP-N-acetylmuramoyl-tripeptide--D-alanyl-D-alanine ligase [Gammaproteobacteria bacterium]
MIQFSLKDAAQLLNTAAPASDIVFQGIHHDSRAIQPGQLFVAIKGERFDGHQFIQAAQQKGAIAALVMHPTEIDFPQLIVKDTIQALGQITTAWRNQFALPCIGVTGSNGKTTLKNMIAAILIAHCDNQPDAVLATMGNLNNEIGLPLTLARFNANHRFAVIEMGMNHFGEIHRLTLLTRPTIAVITNAAESHLAGVSDLQGVAKAKGEILDGLDSNGIAILNRDDQFYEMWRKQLGTRQHFSFGLENPADFSAHSINDSHAIFKTLQGEFPVTLSLLGKHNLMNALAAAAATLAAGASITAVQQGLAKVEAAPGRMQRHQLDNGATLIDDTYNANPFSLQAAVATLQNSLGHKILVLGDMKELGPQEKIFHKEAGDKIRAAGIDQLYTYGNLTQETAKSFGKNAQHFTDQRELISTLLPHLNEKTIVLVKGSRSMKMENIIHALLNGS